MCPAATLIEFSKSAQVYWPLPVESFLFLMDLAVFLIFARIIYYMKWRKNRIKLKSLSRPIWIYLFAQCFWSGSSIAYPAYILLRWQPPEIALKNGDETHSPLAQYALYATGLFQLNYFASAPIAVLFLTIERCLAFFPGQKQRFEWRIARANLFALIGAYLLSMAVYCTALPLDMGVLATCRYAACLMKLGLSNYVQLGMKVAICSVNLCLSILFFCLFYKFQKENESSATNILRNRFIKFMLIMEILFEILPSLLALFLNLVPTIIGYTYFYDASMALCALNAACCGLYYSGMFIGGNQNKNLVNGQQTQMKIICRKVMPTVVKSSHF